MDQSTIKELLAKQHISPKAKLEAFLATSLKLRPASQVTIPAELPSGLEMGKKIDQAVQPHMVKLQKIKDIRQRASAVQKLKKLLERHFEEVVEGSEEYRAYYEWAKNNGLRVNQIKVRPTVHEMYFYTDRGTGRKINGLMREREKIRRKVQRKPGQNVNSIRFAYPEEFEPKWLKSLGHILGYPDCCVEQYADDRKNEVNVEARAAKQLVDALKEEDVDTHVYYTGYFFPCTPRCEKALEKGYHWHEAFKELDMNLGSMYEQNIYVNTELVLKQPELIQRYLSQFKPTTSD
jgi:hypothetical protein